MLKVSALFTAVMSAVLFSACAGAPAVVAARNDSNSSAREAEAAAMDALAALDGGGTARSSSARNTGTPPGSSSLTGAGGGTNAVPQSSAAAGAASGAKPAWVDNPSAVYGSANYLSAQGTGGDRQQAERAALAALVGLFGQSIQADLKTISTYSEAVKSGAIQVEENTSVQNAVNISAEMDTLVGAEIAGVWFDGQRTYYAAAIMEKEKTSVLYADLIRSNERIIGDITTMTPELKNSLDGYSRYLLAGTIADANRVYANVLRMVGNTRGIDPAAMKKGDDYRFEAASVAKNIPIGVTVEGDKGNRIRAAFAKAISAAGFRSGGTNSRYIVKASYSTTLVEYPNNQYKHVRYLVNAELADTANGDSVLIPYSAGDRESHLSVANAEERALAGAEKKITPEFETALREYLASLMPGQ